MDDTVSLKIDENFKFLLFGFLLQLHHPKTSIDASKPKIKRWVIIDEVDIESVKLLINIDLSSQFVI